MGEERADGFEELEGLTPNRLEHEVALLDGWFMMKRPDTGQDVWGRMLGGYDGVLQVIPPRYLSEGKSLELPLKLAGQGVTVCITAGPDVFKEYEATWSVVVCVHGVYFSFFGDGLERLLCEIYVWVMRKLAEVEAS